MIYVFLVWTLANIKQDNETATNSGKKNDSYYVENFFTYRVEILDKIHRISNVIDLDQA